MSVVNDIVPQRVTRFVEFCGVGAVGMVVDLAITFALLGRFDPVLANAAGFAVAVSHNFAGNWWLTFDRPDGHLGRQYLSYVGLHLTTFAVRAVVLSVVLATTALPATVATLIGVAVAAALNFLGTETIFEHEPAAIANRLAHAVYRSPLRRVLLATGLYNVVFGIYAQGLAAAVRGSTRRIEAGDATAEIATATPTETVSVLHTLEKEGVILDRFAADVRAGDTVLDVGANLGVYSAVAAELGAAVAAVEPHPPTAQRCRVNVPEATVEALALGHSAGTVGLDVTRDAVGTQRPSVGGGDHTVPQLPGDRLATPDVLKVDVEGAEVAVLDGLARTLAEAPPRVVYVETHGDREAAVRERLATAGYEIEGIEIGADETMLRGER